VDDTILTTDCLVGLRDELGHDLWSFFPETAEIGVETIKVGFKSKLKHSRGRDAQDRVAVALAPIRK